MINGHEMIDMLRKTIRSNEERIKYTKKKSLQIVRCFQEYRRKIVFFFYSLFGKNLSRNSDIQHDICHQIFYVEFFFFFWTRKHRSYHLPARTITPWRRGSPTTILNTSLSCRSSHFTYHIYIYKLYMYVELTI